MTINLRIIAERHQSSTANEKGFSSDPRTIPLSAAGVLAAQEAAEKLTVEPFAIIASSMTRSLASAAPYWARYPKAVRQVWPLQEEWVYWNMGDRPPLSGVERAKMVEDFFSRADPDARDDHPDSESFRELLNRLVQWQNQLVAYSKAAPEGACIVLISHGYFLTLARILCERNGQILGSLLQLMQDVRLDMAQRPIRNGERIDLEFGHVWPQSGPERNIQIVNFDGRLASVIRACVIHQTIRKSIYLEPGERVILLSGLGTADCQYLGHASIEAVSPIHLFQGSDGPVMRIQEVHGSAFELRAKSLEIFALAEGFHSGAHMVSHIESEHGALPFEGVLVKFSKGFPARKATK